MIFIRYLISGKSQPVQHRKGALRVIQGDLNPFAAPLHQLFSGQLLQEGAVMDDPVICGDLGQFL